MPAASALMVSSDQFSGFDVELVGRVWGHEEATATATRLRALDVS